MYAECVIADIYRTKTLAREGLRFSKTTLYILPYCMDLENNKSISTTSVKCNKQEVQLKLAWTA